MDLYFLDDGSLIIDGPHSIQLIENVEIIRTINSNKLSGLTGREAFDLLCSKFEFKEKLQIGEDGISIVEPTEERSSKG